MFGSALAWSSTRLGLVKSVDLLMSHWLIHMVSLLGAKMLFLIRLAWEASETQFASTGIVQSHLNCFYLSWARNSARLGSELVPVGLRIVVRLDSGLVWLLGSRANTRTRLDSTRSSARFAQTRISSRLGSARYSGFRLPRLVNRARLGAHSGLGEPAQCSAQLSSGLSSGLSWGLAGG